MDDARSVGAETDDGKEHDAVLRMLSSDEWQQRLEQARFARASVLAKRADRKPTLADLRQAKPVRLRLVPETSANEAFFDEDDVEPDGPPADAPPVMPVFRREGPSPAPVVPAIRLNQRVVVPVAPPRPPSPVRPAQDGVPTPRPKLRAADILPALAAQAPSPVPAPVPAPERGPRLGSRIVAGFALGMIAGVGASLLVWITRPAPMTTALPATAAAPAAPGPVGSEPGLPVMPGIDTGNPVTPLPLQPQPNSLPPSPLAAAPGSELGIASAAALAPPGIWTQAEPLAAALPDTPDAPFGTAGIANVAIPGTPAAPALPDASYDTAPQEAVTLAALHPVVVDMPSGAETRTSAFAFPAHPPALPGRVPPVTSGAVAPGLGTPPAAGIALPQIEPPPQPPIASAPTGPEGGPTAVVRLLVPVEQDATAAEGLAEATKAAGFTIEATDPVSVTIRATHVRFYHAGDGAAAQRLAGSIGGEARDFTSSSVRVPEGTIELWMQGGASGPAIKPKVAKTKVAKTKQAKAAKPASKPAKAAAPREDPQVRALRDKVLNKLKTVNKS